LSEDFRVVLAGIEGKEASWLYQGCEGRNDVGSERDHDHEMREFNRDHDVV